MTRLSWLLLPSLLALSGCAAVRAEAPAPDDPASPRAEEAPPAPAAIAPASSRPATVYTCPMHPEVRASAPGQCPTCGMTLVPATGEDEHPHEHGTSTP